MVKVLQYFSSGKRQQVAVQGLDEGRQASRRRAGDPVRFPVRPQAAAAQVIRLIEAQPRSVQSRLAVVSGHSTLIAPVDRGRTTVIPTETVAVVGARKAELTWARRHLGLEPVQEGSHGKVLLTVAADGDDPVARAAEASRILYERGNVASAHPNFWRFVQRPGPAAAGTSTQWGLDNAGSPGVAGADVAAKAAWTITTGAPEVRIAVLDEGVDTKHPYLKPGLAAERDFVDGNPTAAPDGDDAHGTACAGIALSRNSNVSGLAPGCSLVAARIAKSDGGAGWLFDDFNTADAIDWCWDDAQAAVLSNSWGGGPPVDVITSAFARARTQGRGGKGAVVVVAAGNAQAPVDYPGNLADILTVGASNQWDERKTRTSRDGENWWGSNFGTGLDLMAPGVKIRTTDISGARGYSPSSTTPTFNGTSSATPFVAAVAALLISVRPTLTELQVRQIINRTTDPMVATAGWNRLVGFGRVNAFTALRAARRA